MNFLQHLLSAFLSSLILATVLVITQCRYTFSSIRKSFVKNVRRRNSNASSAKNGNHKKGNNSSNNNKKAQQPIYHPNEGTYTLAFFHPYCSSGGGGERVLWKIVQALGEIKEEACRAAAATTSSSAAGQRSGNTANKHSGRSKYEKEKDVKRLIGNVNCENLAVVIYTVDEPRENYASGWSHITCILYSFPLVCNG